MPLQDLFVSAIHHDYAEKFRRDLAYKILTAQRALAEKGYSTGGRAPYGLCRWLVRPDATPVRKLADGERVQTKGHHVIWASDDSERWGTRRRILGLLFTLPASAIARILTLEGVPSPDAGHARKDGGIRRAVSGTWHRAQSRRSGGTR